MIEDSEPIEEPRPLQLTRRQEDVVSALVSAENETHPLSQWYHGALYTLSNGNNPDRIAQAAHSLRELLEKLPRVLTGNAPPAGPNNFQELRRELATRFGNDRERYSMGWEGAAIDSALSLTIEKASIYFENSQQPSRREQIQSTFLTTDPLASQLDKGIVQAKGDAVHRLWRQLEGLAHHGGADKQGFHE